jgi:hypothetical protein
MKEADQRERDALVGPERKPHTPTTWFNCLLVEVASVIGFEEFSGHP